jgi:hypothetical protein
MYQVGNSMMRVSSARIMVRDGFAQNKKRSIMGGENQSIDG